MMQRAAFVTSSGCLRWPSRSARFACPCTYHEWHELAMGSWSLTVGTRHRSYLFIWDGRDGVMSVQGPFHAGQGSASNSPSIAEEQLGIPPSVDPFQCVERFFQLHRNA